MKTKLAALVLAALAVTATPALAATPVRHLPNPPGVTEAHALRMTFDGRVLGYVERDTRGPAVWGGSGVRELSTGNSITVTTNRLGDIGGATLVNAGYRATLWRGGKTLDLGIDGTNSYVWSLNDRGEALVLGQYYDGGGHTKTLLRVWRDGKTTEVPAGDFGAIWVLGADGSVVIGGFGEVRVYRGARYTSTAIPPQVLFWPIDSDSRGGVLGFYGNDAAEFRMVRLRAGRLTDLGTLGGPTASPGQPQDVLGSSHTAMNESGVVVGASSLPDGHDHAFRWEDGVMTDLTPGAERSAAVAVNEAGDVTGTVVGADDVERPFLWHRGKLTTMPVGQGQTVSVTGLHPLLPKVIGSLDGQAFIWG